MAVGGGGFCFGRGGGAAADNFVGRVCFLFGEILRGATASATVVAVAVVDTVVAVAEVTVLAVVAEAIAVVVVVVVALVPRS